MQLKRSILVLSVLLGSVVKTPQSDVIYLTNGNVLIVEKAWEEDGQVRYRAGEKVETLSKSSVRRIQEQRPLATTEESTKKYPFASEVKSTELGNSQEPVIPSPLRVKGESVSPEILSRLKDEVRQHPNNLRAKARLSTVLMALASLQATEGDLKAAESNLEEAVKLDQKDAAALFSLAAVCFRTGKYRAAEDWLVACLQIDSSDQATHYLLGETYYAQEKIGQAINEWNLALKIGPSQTISNRLAKAIGESGTHNGLGVIQSAHFILRYDREVSDYHLGEQILTSLEQLYRKLSTELLSQPSATIAVILYPDQTYFDVTRAPSWSGALFDGKIRVPTKGLGMVTEELLAVLTHELTHSFLASLPGGPCPTWFNEGLAQWQESKSAIAYAKQLAQTKRRNELIPLESLAGSFVGMSSREAALAYLEAISAVEYLVSAHGKNALRGILDLMAKNWSFDRAFQASTHQSVKDFELNWGNSLAQ